MKQCFKCGKSEEEAKLVDAIAGGEVIKICEDCSKREEIPVIRRPSAQQLKESEKKYTVKERLRRMSGTDKKEKKEVTLDDLKKREIEKVKKEKRDKNRPLNLVDNFNWEILRARRKEKLTRKQLAEKIQESEAAIKMVENNQLPENSWQLLRRLEQFFQIKLIGEDTGSEEERIKEAINEKFRKNKESEKLRFNKDTTKKITVGELKKRQEEQEKKEGLTPQEKKAQDLIRQVEKEDKEREKRRIEKAKKQIEKENKEDGGMVGEVELE